MPMEVIINTSLFSVDNNLQCQPLEDNEEKVLLMINLPSTKVENTCETFSIKRHGVSTFIFILVCNTNKKQMKIA